MASALAKEAAASKTGLDKATALLKRVDWFRVMKMTAGTAASLEERYRQSPFSQRHPRARFEVIDAAFLSKLSRR